MQYSINKYSHYLPEYLRYSECQGTHQDYPPSPRVVQPEGQVVTVSMGRIGCELRKRVGTIRVQQ